MVLDSYTSRGQVTHHPLGIAIALFLVGEHGLVCIAERKIESLRREVSNDVGGVTTP